MSPAMRAGLHKHAGYVVMSALVALCWTGFRDWTVGDLLPGCDTFAFVWGLVYAYTYTAGKWASLIEEATHG